MTVTDAKPIISTRLALEDGHTIDRYLATGGYEGFKTALTKTPTQVGDEVKTASLLGRGGAGFPAGTKWGFCPPGVWPRYLVVNGDESEPGTYKDRLLMEKDPHQLIEGVLIACYAIGAAQAFLYVRGEMALAQERIAQALNDAYAAGYVGQNILGTDFSVDIVLHWGAGAYIVGEETALIESLEGNRGMPRLKPPFFPAAKGLYLQPTVVNNVETLANLPWIMQNGGAKFAELGAETSKGMRMFAVSGHVRNPGVFEVEYGVTTFRDLIYAPVYGGGLLEGRSLKAFIPGGASAPWFYEEHLDLPLEKVTIDQAGSMLGSGAIVVMDDTTDAVKACWRVVRFFARESCGKCTPCREGTSWLEKILRRILDGHGRPDDIALLLDVSDNISPGIAWPPKQTTICPLGPSAVSPIASAIVRFKDEFLAYTGGTGESPVAINGKAYIPVSAGMTDVQAPETLIIEVNGKPVEAKPGELVIEAAERAGTYIPRFCYHPRMEPVGMCRMCVVEIDTGRGPALQPACMIPVAPDMKVDTESEVTKKAQDGVLEFLLVNHPLDCPVCDKGGECPLQDQTMSYGPGESRMVEEKRHYEKPIMISDLVALDRERCILCDRCTRFAKDVAGDTLIHFQDRGNQTQVNTFPDHPFASYFSGNTVQICPVGALTASPYRFKARPWDLDQAESTCQGCSVGCRTLVQSSRNEILRYQGVDIDPVNWGWLCDKGRFGFEAVNSEDRLGGPLVKDGGGLVEVPWSAALSKAAAALKAAAPEKVAVLGGARLTNENAYAWAKLAKGVIGTDNVDAQLGDGLPPELVLGLPRATIDQVCAPGGTVLVLAPDLKEELPVLFLRLRHAVTNDRVSVIEVASQATSITPLATASLRALPGSLGEVTAALVAGSASQDVGGITPDEIRATAALLQAGPVTVILGRPNLGEAPDGLEAAAGAIHAAHPEVRFLSALRRGNVHGALDMGLTPGLLPGRTTLADGGAWYRGAGWTKVPAAEGLDAHGILEAAAGGKVDVLVLLGADPMSDFPDRDLAQRALAGAGTVIALDGFLTASSSQADVVLAVAGPTEAEGTTTNLEGRVSSVAQKITPPGTARADWMVAAELARLLGTDLGLTSPAQIWAEIERLSPVHGGITWEQLHAPEGRDGVVAGPPAAPAPAASGPADAETVADPDAATAANDGDAAESAEEQQAAEAEATEAQADAEADAEPSIPPPPPAPSRPAVVAFEAPGPIAAPPVDAYSLRLLASRKLYDQGTAVQRSPHLAGLAPGTALRLHPYDFDRLGITAGATVTVTSPRGTVTLPAQADAGVARGAAAVYVNQAGPSIGSLLDAGSVVTEVRVAKA